MRYRYRPPADAPWLDSLDDHQVRYWIMDNFDDRTARALLTVREKYRMAGVYDKPEDMVDGLLFDSLNCLTDETWRDLWVVDDSISNPVV